MKHQSNILALKYRPSDFSDLIGQEYLVETIQKSIELNKIPNAYIFTGIRGVGKTTTARIVAKMLNCTVFDDSNRPDLQKCDQALAISEDRHPDVIEIDAASNTSVENAREIIENVKYNPVLGKYKVYIIDEVHMLSKSAFNALLKTLEEPPPHSKFIFATTEISKVPITILSRCQRFDLRRIKMEEMKNFLRTITEKEKGNVDDKALSLIAKASEGSVRDALSILDQAIITFNLQNEEVTEVKVREMLGLADQSRIIDLLTLIIEGSQKEALQESENIFDIGADPKIILQSMLEIIYLISRTKSFGKIENDLSVSESESSQIKALADKIDLTYISMLWHFTLKGIEELNIVPDPFLSFQMLMIRLCHLKNMPDPQSVLSDDMSEDLDEELVQENDNSSSATKLDPAVSTTQIKNTIQEKKEAPKTKPEILNENTSKTAIQSFQDLINLANKNREIELKFDLERNVRLVKFEQGKIDISFNEHLSKDFIKNLSQKLIEWTGKRWIITLSKDQGQTTVHEIKQQVKAKLIEEMKQTDEYKKILEAFPDAELIDVQDKEED